MEEINARKSTCNITDVGQHFWHDNSVTVVSRQCAVTAVSRQCAVTAVSRQCAVLAADVVTSADAPRSVTALIGRGPPVSTC